MKIATHIFGPCNIKIILKARAGTSPDSSALADIRTIARTCLADGGRAVLGARGLAKTWLQEYYDDTNCQQPQGRSALVHPFEKHELQLKIRPNPTRGEITIQLGAVAEGSNELLIVNFHGQVMKRILLSPNQSELLVHTEDWPDGLYFVKVPGQGGTTFIIQR